MSDIENHVDESGDKAAVKDGALKKSLAFTDNPIYLSNLVSKARNNRLSFDWLNFSERYREGNGVIVFEVKISNHSGEKLLKFLFCNDNVINIVPCGVDTYGDFPFVNDWSQRKPLKGGNPAFDQAEMMFVGVGNLVNTPEGFVTSRLSLLREDVISSGFTYSPFKFFRKDGSTSWKWLNLARTYVLSTKSEALASTAISIGFV